LKSLFTLVFAFQRFKQKRLSIHASSLALYFILSIFPTILITLIILNALFINSTLYQTFINELNNFISGNLIKLLGISVSNFKNIAISYGSISFIMVIIFSNTFIKGLYNSIHYIFNINKHRSKTKFALPLFSSVILVLIIVLFTAIKLLSTFLLKYLSNFLNLKVDVFFQFKIFYYIISWVIIILLLYFILRKNIKFYLLILASLFSLLSIIITSKLYFLIVNKSIYNLLYGSISTIIVSIMYLWFIFNLLLFILNYFYIYQNFMLVAKNYLKPENKKLIYLLIKKLFDLIKSSYTLHDEKNIINLQYENKSFIIKEIIRSN